MKNKQEIKDTIIKLMDNDLSEKAVDIKLLPASGSSRIYYRIKTDNTNYIATYNSNIEENVAFLEFSKHFKNADLPVPHIIAVNEENILSFVFFVLFKILIAPLIDLFFILQIKNIFPS